MTKHSMSHGTPLGGLWRPGWRGEGTQQMFIRGGLAPRSNFLPFYTPFFTEKYPFRMPSIDIPCLEFCIPFNCCKCITKKTFSRLYKAIKFICYPFQAISQTQMTDFPTLSYTSTIEIPTLSYTWSLKRVPLPRRASPYRPSSGVPPSPTHWGWDERSDGGELFKRKFKNIRFTVSFIRSFC